MTKPEWGRTSFHVNPVSREEILFLNVTLDDTRIDIDLAIEAAPFFEVGKDEAAKEAKRILSVLGSM